ncbi:MAG: hypothetical protein A2787_00550 [Omnitrophica WOR_2 bacterium RIFCSPHIGHO2_01_FULL_48_9]|nr:MAG: hypothetical protein A3D10_00035 [Omnitrophica WOR_2 bacterium RIFCSPHIGHO2_02_FULL_48_11]OGX33622.1 MAG: hypothetical protein A2787_00550 [Omnitrophica WOR_2 bacterium RIFCSPHIGHO2_01_FULL_48_9]
MAIRYHNARGFAGFVGLLLTVFILGLLYYFFFNRNPTRPALDEATKDIVHDLNIDTSSHQGILNSTVSEIKRLEKMQLEQAEQIDLYHLPGTEN